MISQQERVKALKGSVRYVNDFPKPGVNFCDIMPIFEDPKLLHYAVDSLEHALQGVEFDKLVCLQSRGFLFGSALAYKIRKPFIPVRKLGKLPGECLTVAYSLEYGKDSVQVQKSAFKKGDRVVLFDDVLATGGTMSAAIKLVKEAGADIVKVMFFVDVPVLKGLDKLGVPKEDVILLQHI